MEQTYIDFSVDASNIERRVLAFLKLHPDKAAAVKAAVHVKTRVGDAKTKEGPLWHKEWNCGQHPRLDLLAQHIAQFIGQYVDGKHGQSYRGATLRIP